MSAVLLAAPAPAAPSLVLGAPLALDAPAAPAAPTRTNYPQPVRLSAELEAACAALGARVGMDYRMEPFRSHLARTLLTEGMDEDRAAQSIKRGSSAWRSDRRRSRPRRPLG